MNCKKQSASQGRTRIEAETPIHGVHLPDLGGDEMNKAQVVSLLMSNDRAVERAMVALYNRQTVDEQRTSSTSHLNGRGFNAFHAERGTYWAKWVMSGRRLTGKHLDGARRMACHYARQLAELSQQPAVPPTRTYKFPTVEAMWAALTRLDPFVTEQGSYPGVTQGL